MFPPLFRNRELLIDTDDSPLPEGSIIKNPKYADSLRKIQANYDDLNTGNLSKVNFFTSNLIKNNYWVHPIFDIILNI